MAIEKITINDVAQALGISKTTVSRAISGKGRISPETTARVQKYISEHNYKPSLLAKGFAEQRTYNVAVVWPMDADFVSLPFLQQAMLGMSEVLREFDNNLLICMIRGEDISHLEEITANHQVDGVILTRTLVKDPSEEYLKSAGVPFVCLGSSRDDSVMTVDDDHYTACRELTSILLGRTRGGRIALLGGSRDSNITNIRYRGYADAVREAGEQVDESIVYYDVDSEQKVQNILDELRNKSVGTAICMDDAICGNLLEGCRKSGIKIPSQLRVASFYDSKVLANASPAITSLNFDGRQLGREAAHMILDLIDGKTTCKRTLSTYEIILKESTK